MSYGYTWPAIACRSCGVAPPRLDRFYQDPEHPEEIVCILCYRWLRCWLAGLVSAADRQAFWVTRAADGSPRYGQEGFD